MELNAQFIFLALFLYALIGGKCLSQQEQTSIGEKLQQYCQYYTQSAMHEEECMNAYNIIS